jgi:Alkylmercury lyase
MTRHNGRISSADPSSGQPITVTLDDQGWHWRPATTMVLAGTAMVLAGTAVVGDACSRVADCCPHINFHASPRDADDYRRAHPALAAEPLDQDEAVEAARRIFAGLLHQQPGNDAAGHCPAGGQHE